MAQLKVLKCRRCFYPLPEGVLKCPKCGMEHKVADDAPINPLLLPPDVTNDYVNYFKQKTEENPKDTNALFGMGLVYMGLKNYELAQRNFKLAVDQMPLEPDVYYYFALSLFEGHNPKHINPKTADRIEEWLHTAANRQQKRKYLILQMVLRQCAFVANGLQFKGESPMELMDKVRTIAAEQDDVREIRDHVKITDKQANEWLDELQGKGRKKESDNERENRYYAKQYEYTGRWPLHRTKDDSVLSYPDEPEKVGKWLLDEQTRADFFNYLYVPDEPVKLSKPSLPFGFLLKRLILIPVGMLIAIFIVTLTEFGLSEKEDLQPVQSVQAEYKELYGKKGEGAAARKKHIAELRKDSIERAQMDSTYFADNYVFVSRMRDSEGNERAQWFIPPTWEQRSEIYYYSGIEKTWKGLVALLIVILPLLIGILRIIIRFASVNRQRRQIDAENQARQDAYDHALYMFNEGRPSIADYVLFCKHYLSKESPLLPYTADPVSMALQDNHIDELDMKGKILFMNYFDDVDNNGNPSREPHDMLSRIYYVIAIPQADKLTLLYNYWDTQSNHIDSCDAESIYYKNILGVTKKSDGIYIEKVGGKVSTIAFPPDGGPSICAYQGEFPEYITFSNTRTGNPQDFLDALNALVAAYK